MELALITLEQVLVLFLMILAGFICVKIGAIKIEGKNHFTDLLMSLVVPAMVVHSYMMEFDPSVFANLISVAGWSLVCVLIGFVITMCLTSRMQDRNRPILRCLCIISNASFMGFPLIQALYGSEGLLYASIFLTILTTFLWTVQYSMLAGKVKIGEVLRVLCTMPVILAMVIGLIIYLFQIPVPELLKRTLNTVGSMTTPLSMIMTGMIIAGSSIGRQLREKRLALVILLRLFLIPAVCFALFVLVGLRGMASEVILILMASPSAAVCTIFAVQFGYDEEMTAGAVVITTFLSIFTLPMWAFLIGAMIGV